MEVSSMLRLESCTRDTKPKMLNVKTSLKSEPVAAEMQLRGIQLKDALGTAGAS